MAVNAAVSVALNAAADAALPQVAKCAMGCRDQMLQFFHGLCFSNINMNDFLRLLVWATMWYWYCWGHIQRYYPNNFDRFMVLPTTTKALGNSHYYSTEHCCMYRYGSISGLAVLPLTYPSNMYHAGDWMLHHKKTHSQSKPRAPNCHCQELWEAVCT